LHLKWPWPIDTARRFETGKVHELLLGVGEERTPVIIKGREVYLWSQEHGARRELDFLLAVPPRAGEVALQETKKPPPPVNIIKLVVAVQYVIDDPYKFGYRYTDSAKALECIASREMSRYCASATLDSPVPGGAVDRPEAIMTYGRERAAAELKKRIQEGAEEADLGVAIRYVGLVTVHPPAEAAPAYEAVPEAERRMMLTRYEAEGEAKKILAQVAGSPMAALKLALAIQTLEDLEKLRDRPAETEKILAEQIRQAEDNIQVLQKEIEQERLLGLAREGEGKTTKQQLLEAYKEYQKLFEKIRSPAAVDLDKEISLARQETDDLLRQTVGDPARVIAEAEGYQRIQELTEAARAEAFQRELLAYQASPNMYIMDRWLDVWDEVLPDMTKYVLGVDREKIEIWLNWESQADVLEDVTFTKEGAK
jgi:regulator of protease activity HflC (stomatin/prohibitin superfamily)